MTLLDIDAGPFKFVGRLEEKLAPQTCAWFRALLPYEERLVHVRWSGEGVWVPLGDLNPALGWENHTRYPAPGHFILYPGGFGETEILLAYGGVSFASKVGPLAGNHFLTIVDGIEKLPELGRRVLWEGAQAIRFTLK